MDADRLRKMPAAIHKWQRKNRGRAGTGLLIHHGPKAVPLAERIWPRVEKTETCWLWTGGGKNHGYAMLPINDNGKSSSILVHRWMYEMFNGPIPKGLHVDHLCRVRNCVNPAHLEAVTPKENNRRSTSPSAKNAVKTHCKHGHAFTEENTYLDSKGSRLCRACQTRNGRNYKLRLNAAGLTQHGVTPTPRIPVTHCIHGHEYTPENTVMRSHRNGSYRACRKCVNARARKRNNGSRGRSSNLETSRAITSCTEEPQSNDK